MVWVDFSATSLTAARPMSQSTQLESGDGSKTTSLETLGNLNLEFPDR